MKDKTESQMRDYIESEYEKSGYSSYRQFCIAREMDPIALSRSLKGIVSPTLALSMGFEMQTEKKFVWVGV